VDGLVDFGFEFKELLNLLPILKTNFEDDFERYFLAARWI
jgi:hypothetical protein